MAKEIPEKLKSQLKELAQKYETSEFSNGDPSFILNCYSNFHQTEIAAFITALLSFGQRQQFLKKIDYILKLAQNDIYLWIKCGKWQTDFPNGQKKFYRFYSFDDLRKVFSSLQEILAQHESFGKAVKTEYEKKMTDKALQKTPRAIILASAISELFPKCKIVPHGRQSANKRIHMFLRWMVRTNSAVDKGLWTWFDKKDLIIPLDTHVLQMAKEFHIVEKNAAANAKTAVAITETLKSIWLDDPVKGDFALFGYGVDRI